jgi:hypothetical protein
MAPSCGGSCCSCCLWQSPHAANCLRRLTVLSDLQANSPTPAACWAQGSRLNKGRGAQASKHLVTQHDMHMCAQAERHAAGGACGLAQHVPAALAYKVGQLPLAGTWQDQLPGTAVAGWLLQKSICILVLQPTLSSCYRGCPRTCSPLSCSHCPTQAGIGFHVHICLVLSIVYSRKRVVSTKACASQPPTMPRMHKRPGHRAALLQIAAAAGLPQTATWYIRDGLARLLQVSKRPRQQQGAGRVPAAGSRPACA